MTYVIEPPATVSLPVLGESGRFPVSSVFCVGRNYADHAIEMGHDPDREAPFFFIKPAWSVLEDGATLEYPAFSEDVHHEIELVVALGKGGRNVVVDDAMSLVYGYAVGIDMTRRDLQQEAKDKSRPWEAGKSFVGAAPCSAIMPISQCGQIDSAAISLAVNGDTRQAGDVNQMIWKVPEVIARLSELFVLNPGDLIFTGTPAGVGPIERGDKLAGVVAGVGTLSVDVF